MTDTPDAATLTLDVAFGTNNLGRVKNVKVDWAKLAKRLTTFHQTSETYADFMKLTKKQQDELKNEKGYWIAGYCEDGRRAKAAIKNRSAIALDIDYPRPEIMDLIEQGLLWIHDLELAGHSTRKHCPELPRIRLVFPLAEPLSPEEYGPASRVLAYKIDKTMRTVDYVSFRVAQMMFLPTASCDSELWKWHQKGKLLDGKALIASWPKGTPWPQHPDVAGRHESAKEAEDPRTKKGLIGAFCRVFDIFRAMDELIPDTYEPADEYSAKPRYSYTQGTSTSGAIVEDDGLFLYSHHSSDPCADQLVNSWDMVRIHKYGHLDNGIDKGTPPNQWPSQKAMEEEFAEHPEVIEELQQTYAAAFDDGTGTPEGEPLRKAGSEAPGGAGGGDGDGGGANDEDPVGAPTLTHIERMNSLHAVARINGKVSILNFEDEGKLTQSSVKDFHDYYANRPSPVATQQNKKISHFFMEHPQRPTYPNGIVFDPKHLNVEGAYNLWHGLTVKPDPNASCEKFLEHLKHAICGGHEGHYCWLINYFAHMVQKPWVKPGVAIVLKGIQGSGKDLVGHFVGAMIERNHITITHMDHLYGRFNVHMAQAILLHVQEAHWGKSNRDANTLKGLITEGRSIVEAKYVTPYMVNSYYRLLMTSNEEQVVNAHWDERRFAVFELPATERPPYSYFKPIYDELHNGGPAALLCFLQNWQVDDELVIRIPKTEGLARQKAEGLVNVARWWKEMLLSEELPVDFDSETSWQEGPQIVSRADLYRSYVGWMQDNRYQGDRKTEDAFGREFARLCPHEDIRPRRDGRPVRCRIIPALPIARAAFAKATGTPLIDEDDEEDLIG